jgi:hypothetical protein
MSIGSPADAAVRLQIIGHRLQLKLTLGIRVLCATLKEAQLEPRMVTGAGTSTAEVDATLGVYAEPQAVPQTQPNTTQQKITCTRTCCQTEKLRTILFGPLEKVAIRGLKTKEITLTGI